MVSYIVSLEFCTSSLILDRFPGILMNLFTTVNLQPFESLMSSPRLTRVCLQVPLQPISDLEPPRQLRPTQL
jgi:hypothetical protein